MTTHSIRAEINQCSIIESKFNVSKLDGSPIAISNKVILALIYGKEKCAQFLSLYGIFS